MVPEALAEYEKANTARPTDVTVALKLAALYRRAGRYNPELELLQRTLEKGASDRELVCLALGDFYRTFGLLPEAADTYVKAGQMAPGYADALVAQAEVEVALGRLDRAFDTSAKAVDRSRGTPRAVTVRALALFSRGDVERARAELERLVAGAATPAYAPAANLLGVAQFVQGAYAEAVKSFVLAAKTDPWLVQAVTNLGIVYLLAGKPEEAEKLFTLAAARDPADAEPIAGLGLVAVLKPAAPPKPADAKAPAAPAPPAPADPGAKADAKAAEPKAADAHALFDKALAVDPRDPYVICALGLLACQAKDPAEAEKQFRNVLRLDPDYVPALYALGTVLLAAGRGEEAEICFARVAARADATPEEQLALALARCARREFAKAADDLQRLQMAIPRNARLWNALAYVDYTHLGKVKDAIAKLEQALTCDPKDDYAPVILTKIRDAASRVLWEDAFDRPDADDLGNPWVEMENTGVDIKVVDKQCLFSGTQKLNDWFDTTAEREVACDVFISVEAEFEPREVNRAVVGLRVNYGTVGVGVNKGVYLVRDDRGRFAYSEHASSVLVPQWKPVTVAVPEASGASGKPVFRFKIVKPPLGDTAKAQPFKLYINDVEVGSVDTPLRDQQPRYTVALFTRAMKNIPIEFAVDNVKIYERKD
jgi:tetratricopeptide (TPR) repeat protein